MEIEIKIDRDTDIDNIHMCLYLNLQKFVLICSHMHIGFRLERPRLTSKTSVWAEGWGTLFCCSKHPTYNTYEPQVSCTQASIWIPTVWGLRGLPRPCISGGYHWRRGVGGGGGGEAQNAPQPYISFISDWDKGFTVYSRGNFDGSQCISYYTVEF